MHYSWGTMRRGGVIPVLQTPGPPCFLYFSDLLVLQPSPQAPNPNSFLISFECIPFPTKLLLLLLNRLSCPTPYDPRDNSPPGSPVPGILQARTLEWVAISFSIPLS